LDAIEWKGLVTQLLLPPAGPLLVAILGMAMAWRRWRGAVAIAAVGVAAAWIVATPIVAQALLHQVEGDLAALTPERWSVARVGARPPRALVVLAGGVAGDPRDHPEVERPHPRSLERTLHGARIARMTGLPVLLSGGVPPRRQVSEAETMRRVLERDLGVRVRWLEQKSRDTAQNASLSAALLKAAGIESVVLVTHAYHMRRAQAAFEAAGVAVLPAPHGFCCTAAGLHWSDLLPGTQAAGEAWIALRELLGLWWYRLNGLA
jgi:uncharacterized SAM-binding protein YcdF (DUF218 family)